MPVLRYEQLMAAGRPQMLPTSNVWGVDAAARHILWCFVLQTACTAPAEERQPVQLVMHQMAESVIVLLCVAED